MVAGGVDASGLPRELTDPKALPSAYELVVEKGSEATKKEFASDLPASALEGLSPADQAAAKADHDLRNKQTTLSELAAEHLSSGTARFAGALVTFLMIGLGVAIGSRLAAAMLGALVGSTASSPAAPAAVALGPPAWLQIAALLLAPLALSVLLRAPRTEIPWIVFIGALGYFGGRLGAEMLEPEVGMFAGALAVGLASGLYERLRKLPGSIPLVPGILMLVPGSIGYRSLTALLAEEVVPGIQTAFRMLLVAASLVAGLLISSALTVERRDRSERSEPATPLVP